MPKDSYRPDSKQTYAIAHSAQCKLHMNADKPDRDLRFILGHAFTLDNALLRVAEIEDMREIEPHMAREVLGKDGETTQSIDTPEGQTGSLARGNVTFDGNFLPMVNSKTRERARRQYQPPSTPMPTPAPTVEDADNSRDEEDALANFSDFESDSDSDSESDTDDLSLTRFVSASAAPPRTVSPNESEKDSDSDSDTSGPESPPSLPADFDIRTLIKGDDNAELSELYHSLRGCRCHDHQGVDCEKVWEVMAPSAELDGDKKARRRRLAVMLVDA